MTARTGLAISKSPGIGRAGGPGDKGCGGGRPIPKGCSPRVAGDLGIPKSIQMVINPCFA
jgi:hypothetical protein